MSQSALSPKNALVAQMVDAGLGAKSTLAKKPLAVLEAEWAQFNSPAEAGSQPDATEVTLDDLADAIEKVQEEDADEDLLGEVDSPEETVPAEDVEVGSTVICTRKRKKNVEVVVGRVRVGRKHVTIYDENDLDIVWVPVGTEIRVLSA